MTDPRKAEAQRLWRAIHTYADIADRLSVSETTVRRWIDGYDPERQRIYDQRRRRFVCTECGEPVSKGATANTLCSACRSKAKHERALRIEQWWAEGRTLKEIGERLGWGRNRLTSEMCALRKVGYDLPLRKPRRDGATAQAGR